ncbi:glycosyltransferase family 2 protein [Flavobacterium sp. KB82]|uniref:Glycosyltransferase family 2 protein n=2 Tax=Flavobacterium hungaricum TaxID=2082725 RepID=A0ABR9TR34_9FLAO|nr:glycosyltransferase [Flavobacterium hungaricum]MBE8727793.1 glycosyltransferase family 2 protein [Flavobacterium hungaricum]
MNFSLVICTYMRPDSLLQLLKSVEEQNLYPNDILIIDGSSNEESKKVVEENQFKRVQYFLVSDQDRGLTKQRNFGVSKLAVETEIVCFLDDDTVLEKGYFEEIIKTFELDSEVVGVGGVALNENKWKPHDSKIMFNKNKYYFFENYIYKEGLRNRARNYLGLASNLGPGKMPAFSHGRTCGFPLTGKSYEVDLLIGMSMSFKRTVFEKIHFSKFFEGYGLYEDADFSLRALQYGKNVINTKAQLNHYHAPSGRPNQYQYGKMVVRNGWYVWRIKNPNPSLNDRFKWNMITILLAIIRFTNVLSGAVESKKAFTETMGRIAGYISLLFNKPRQI